MFPLGCLLCWVGCKYAVSLCARPVQACMLLGGRQDDSIGTYLFKPIQRVCKYPLLFRVSPFHA